MTRIAVTLAALIMSIVAAGPAAAESTPMPRIFRDTPFQKGQWRMEILEMKAKGAQHAGGMPGAMSVCMDDVRDIGRNRAGSKGGAQPDCKVQILKDTAAEAVMETTCPDSTTRATITREGDRSFLMQAAGTSRGEAYAMKARYTYESAQCTQSGAGMGMGASPGAGAGMGAGKDSPQCQQAQAQLSSMNPGVMCANAGANRPSCEQNIMRMKSQLEAMCR